jgi:methylase of polypeptide subunit release factors
LDINVVIDGVNISVSIIENDSAYISPYTEFLVNNIPCVKNYTICDYGTGTGIIGVVSNLLGANKIYCIEPNLDSIQLAKTNVEKNELCFESFIFTTSKYDKILHDVSFNYIFCNPASLPDIAGCNSFYNGGKLGLDMILEVIEFASGHLSNNGRLFLLLTSILPTSIVMEKLQDAGLNYEVVSSFQTIFREHYNKIQTWVDNMSLYYPEMYYSKIGDVLYEEVKLLSIHR